MSSETSHSGFFCNKPRVPFIRNDKFFQKKLNQNNVLTQFTYIQCCKFHFMNFITEIRQ